MKAPPFKSFLIIFILFLAVLLYWIYRQTAIDAALAEAARYGDTAAAEKQLAKGADIHTTAPPELRIALQYRFMSLIPHCKAPPGRTPLAWAVAGNSPRMVRFLLSKGADPSGRHDYEFEPLAVAASVSDISIVKALLDRGADVNSGKGHSDPPLLSAVSSGRLSGETALKRALCFHVIRNGCHYPILSLLLDAGADIEDRNGYTGLTPLMEAARSGDESLVKFLLSRGADANARASGGDTAWRIAMREGHLDVAEALEQAGARKG